MNKAPTKIKNSGQAMIVLLLVVAIASFWLIQVSLLSVASLSLGNEFVEGFVLLNKAEGYLENAALRILRDPNYSGENLQEGEILCTIEVNDLGGDKDLVSFCQRRNRVRRVGMTLSIVEGIYHFGKIEERE